MIISTIERKRQILRDVAAMLLKKNEAYGSDNILMTGIPGVIVRMVDKAYRLNNLITTDSNNFYETLIDTMYDIIGYSIIAVALINGRWGKSNELLATYLSTMVEEIPIHQVSAAATTYELVWVGNRSVTIINILYKAEQKGRLSDSMIGRGQIKTWLNDLINASLIGIVSVQDKNGQSPT